MRNVPQEPTYEISHFRVNTHTHTPTTTQGPGLLTTRHLYLWTNGSEISSRLALNRL